jgi:hypothetical protein
MEDGITIIYTQIESYKVHHFYKLHTCCYDEYAFVQVVVFGYIGQDGQVKPLVITILHLIKSLMNFITSL